MYQSTINFVLFLVLFVFNLYGNTEHSDKKGYLKVELDYPMDYQKDIFLNREIIEVPEVDSTSPEDNKEDVPINTDIKVAFKKATKESTNENIVISIKDDNGNKIDSKRYKSGNQYKFTPSSSLKESTKYSIEVSKYIKLKSGANVIYIDSFSFSTQQDKIAPEFLSSNTKSVYENQKEAITLVATDKGSIDYSISGNDSDKFNVNSSTGVVTFKQAPDFEVKNIYTFMAIAEDTSGNRATQDITINILDKDENGDAPKFISSNTKSVYENQLNAITLIIKNDSEVVYKLSGDDSDEFILNADTGVIRFKQAPDFEVKKIYTFRVEITNGAGNKNTQDITINILDKDEDKPVFTSPSTVSVKENNINAITLIAKDASKVIYSISGDDSDELTVHLQTGVVRFNQVPSFETKKRYTFTAKAQDEEGNEVTQNITITILDAFDPTTDITAPVFISSSIANANENQTNAIMLVATDDKNKVTYSISGDDSDKFILNKQTGVVTFEQAPDFETKNIYTFTAKAMDTVGNKATQDIIINIIDVHETLDDTTKPVFISSNIVNIFENRISVMILVSIDNSKVTYEISGDDSEDFTLNLQTGVITFKKAPDFETKNIYTFTVTVIDSVGNKATKNIIVNILDVDETIADVISPVFISPNIMSINENQVKTIILIATDNNRVVYEISGNDSDKFILNAQTGIMTFKKAPDYNLQKVYTFTAKAKDEAGNETTQKITINISKKDSNEGNNENKIITDIMKPVFVSSNIVNVNENQTDALVLIATDENKINYSIIGDDSDKFILNSQTGLIKFEKAPDFETKNNYTFTAKAKDEAGNETTQKITINVLDVKETLEDTIKPVFISSNTITINEHLASTIILVATDETTITYSISGDDSDEFTLNAQTGIMTFKHDPNYKVKKTYTFTATAKDEAGNEAMQDTTINIVSTDIKFSDNNKIWQSNKQSTKNIFNWQGAKDYCSSLTLGGYNNWHLPSRYNLISLFNKKSNIIDINLHLGDNSYWAFSTYAISSGNAWAVNMEYGFSNWFGKTSSFKHVRCVRPE